MNKRSVYKTVRLSEEERRLIEEIIQIIRERDGIEITASDVIRASLKAYHKVLTTDGKRER